jgi:fucose permease
MAFGALLLIVGRTPLITILGTFLMGLLGVLISALFSMALAEQHGADRAIALTEAAMMASLVSTLAPIAVGFFAGTIFTWRGALVLMMAAGLVLWLLFGKDQLGKDPSTPTEKSDPSVNLSGVLPFRYWLFWVIALLVQAVEFCIIFWAADFLEKVTGLTKANAALGISAFLGSMLVGRWLVSRLLRRSQEQRLLISSLVIALAGFLLFWLVHNPAGAVIGLLITGLGVAGLFPIVNSLALAAAPNQMVKASGAIILSAGLAIFLLPLILGRLADGFGIWLAYGLEVALLVISLGLGLWAGWRQSDL